MRLQRNRRWGDRRAEAVGRPSAAAPWLERRRRRPPRPAAHVPRRRAACSGIVIEMEADYEEIYRRPDRVAGRSHRNPLPHHPRGGDRRRAGRRPRRRPRRSPTFRRPPPARSPVEPGSLEALAAGALTSAACAALAPSARFPRLYRESRPMLEMMRRNSRNAIIYVLFGVIIAMFVINFGPGSRGCSSDAGANRTPPRWTARRSPSRTSASPTSRSRAARCRPQLAQDRRSKSS